MTDARLAADDPALQPLRINPDPLKGKTVLITGIANKDSIAYGCARACKAFGADIAMTYLNDKTREFTEQLAAALAVDPQLFLPLDIQKQEQTAALFDAMQRKWDKLDVMLHAMAFAPMEALHAPVLDCPLDAFQKTMAISVHSLIALAQKAVPLMTDGGSTFTLTYFGGDKVVPHYGIMGPAKSCLEGVVRYLAAELGPKGIRVNAISPGPLLTRAASGIGHFDDLMDMAKERAPEHTLVTPDEIGIAMAALACDHMKKITGDVCFIDGGYNIMG